LQEHLELTEDDFKFQLVYSLLYICYTIAPGVAGTR